jgi:hypothetical protein
VRVALNELKNNETGSVTESRIPGAPPIKESQNAHPLNAASVCVFA